MTGHAYILRGDALALPLPDASVDLIVTSPPYYALRAYTDNGRHYEGQIGSESTPAEYIATLLECTTEWARVLKPSGSIFVNLGDKYSAYGGAHKGHGRNLEGHSRDNDRGGSQALGYRDPQRWGIPAKSLMLLPERYRIGCVDQLGLIARAVIVWDKPNGLPESVTDRVRRSHEDFVHLTKQPRYFAAVDEIREPHAASTVQRALPHRATATGTRSAYQDGMRPQTVMRDQSMNLRGALPGSVWEVPTEPLRVPDHVGVDHFAAFPMTWPRRIILGWSPSEICIACGEGRRPVVARTGLTATSPGNVPTRRIPGEGRNPLSRHGEPGSTLRLSSAAAITGSACACTPYTDHPANGSTTRRDYSPGLRENNAQGTYGRHQAGEYERVGPWREYHLDGWTPPPTRPAVVLDPFAGTGTTMLAAKALGRVGVGVDRSADYCRLAQWRTTDPGELAKAMRVPKPPTEVEGQESLFDALEVSG